LAAHPEEAHGTPVEKHWSIDLAFGDHVIKNGEMIIALSLLK